jgi:hypothetical protein
LWAEQLPEVSYRGTDNGCCFLRDGSEAIHELHAVVNLGARLYFMCALIQFYGSFSRSGSNPTCSHWKPESQASCPYGMVHIGVLSAPGLVICHDLSFLSLVFAHFCLGTGGTGGSVRSGANAGGRRRSDGH